MTLLRQSQLSRLSAPDAFLWATGIEDTFITAPWPKTGRTLDEYELTGHYDRWHADLGLMRELGVRAARYGIPWHRIQPSRDTWNWDFVDRTVDRLLELGIEPIIDLVHYGLPPWIENA
jgi:beta-glucosidase